MNIQADFPGLPMANWNPDMPPGLQEHGNACTVLMGEKGDADHGQHSEQKEPAERSNSHSLCSPDHSARRRKRSVPYSPSGMSPKIKQTSQPQQQQQQKRPPWTREEITFVEEFVSDKGGQENVNWLECSTELFNKFNRSRSAKSCQSIFIRCGDVKKTEQKTQTEDKSTQTDISIGPWDTFAWGKIEKTEVKTNDDNKDKPTSLLRHILSEKGDADQPTEPVATLEQEHEQEENIPYVDHAYSGVANLKKKMKKIKTMSITVDQPPTPSLIDRIKFKLVCSTNDPSSIIRTILDSPFLRKTVTDSLSEDFGQRPQFMKNRVHGEVSTLMKKDYQALEQINFNEIVSEFQRKFPELHQFILHVMVPSNNLRPNLVIPESVMPRLALIYGIILQTRNPELSLIQRVVSACLADNICDQKVFDRLNTLGVSLSYNRSLIVFQQIGDHFMDLLVKAAEDNKYIRFVGDNLNFTVNVSQETSSNHKHMVHMFASAALVSEPYFQDKSSEPQIPLQDLKPEHVLLSVDEYATIRNDIVKIIVDIVSVYLPQLQFMKKSVPSKLSGPDSNLYKHKTEVLPLPVLPFNETSYQDDVKILDYYEDVVKKLIEKVALPNTTKIHIGGDQLTRERFSYAMWLRLGNYDPSARFAHLGPTTFEFFHLGMNFLEKIIFGSLWNKSGSVELGTLKCEKERIIRNNVDPDVKKAYDADKEFVNSFTNAYVVEAVMDYFGMVERNDFPTKNIPPQFGNEELEKEWVYDKVGEIVDNYVFPAWCGKEDDIVLQESSETENYVVLKLSNGTCTRIPIGKSKTVVHRKVKPDKVKNYGHHALESGLIFMYFQSLMKCPDRDRILGLFKMMMVLLKSRSNYAKYPLEILRMLVQQYSLLPLNKATQVLYACFVNTKGKMDTHIPADLQNEWVVKEAKKQIKHMYSNKTTDNITSRSSAIPGIAHIGENFDEKAGCVVRCKAHLKGDSSADDLKMMDDLRKVRPFSHQEGREFKEFQCIRKSHREKFDGYKFCSWFHEHKYNFVA